MAPLGTRALTGAAAAVALAGVAIPLLWRTGADGRTSALAAAAALVAIAVGRVVAIPPAHLAGRSGLAWSSASVVLVLTKEVLAESAYGPDPLPCPVRPGRSGSGCGRCTWPGSWRSSRSFPTGADAGGRGRRCPGVTRSPTYAPGAANPKRSTTARARPAGD